MKALAPEMVYADVVVVGGGGSGLAAAIEAAGTGARTVLLEKNPALGGSTAWSVGSVSVTNSRHQKRAGIADSTDAHFEDLGLFNAQYGNRDNLTLRRILVDNITETFAWLESLGVVFVGPFDEPPHRVPRMHNILPNSRAFPFVLGRAARKAGVDVRCGVKAERLVVEEGRVVGVAALGADGRQTIFRGTRGIVLAAGDYSASAEMKTRFAGADKADLAPVNPTATGDGQRIGMEIGGVLVNGDVLRGPAMRFVPPKNPHPLLRLPPWPSVGRAMRAGYATLPDWLLRPFLMRFLTTALGVSPDLMRQGAIMVNAEGRRFCDETTEANGGTARQTGGLAWLVMDATVSAKFSGWPYFVSTAPGVAYAYMDDYRRTRPDIVHEAETPSALAAAAGLPPGALAETIAEYNAGEGPSRGGERPPLLKPPFLALGPARAYVTFTDGGLSVNTRLEALDGDGKPIPGLFAAGSNGQGGVILEGHGHHLGWAFVSGRIAGRNAAANGTA